jgi:AraC-like DNA-binding protein
MSGEVVPVHYRPHDDSYRPAVEVLHATELRRRVSSDPGRGFERVDFQCVLFVRSGTYTHTIDFETHRCLAGSCLLIGPGQVHRFGTERHWDGWILIVGPHHVPNEIDRLPHHIRTSDELAAALVELFDRMTADASSVIDPAQLDDLLALQARVLVRRLFVGHADTDAAHVDDAMAISRFRDYRSAVDRHYRRWHLVAPYSRHVGCSTKSLNRACQAVSDVTAKRIIVERIILEAKRLLAHGTEPVAVISADLGFDEPTNFVKYFKRETGLTPTQFRSSILTAASR